MPARQLARLIDELHPNVSVRSLEERAGVAPQTVSKWLKPSAPYNRLPDPRAIREVARVLRCPVGDVVVAFNASLNDPLPLNHLPDDELELLAIYRSMSASGASQLLAIANTMSQHAPDQPVVPSGTGARRHHQPRPAPPSSSSSSNVRNSRKAVS